MEGFEAKKENVLSVEQQKKLEGLFPIVKQIFDSFLSPDADSDQAFEIINQIDEFAENLRKQGLNPRDYFLWNLLSPNKDLPEYNGQDFDTPGGDIESFIMSLEEIEQKVAA